MSTVIDIRRGLCALGLALAALPGQSAPSSAAEPAPGEADRGSYLNAWEAGRGTFIDACAICHGAFAYGDGIAADSLAKAPPDLTQLSMNNGGEFPWVEVYEIIDGRKNIAAHGTRAMPAWGELWTQTLASDSARYTDVYVRGRILELLLYLDSIQEM